jgi:hypothetical protein
MSAVSEAMREVSQAARSFEARWQLSSLKLLDSELHDRFVGQRADWEQAIVTGDKDEICEQTAGLCRGWLAVTKRMGEAEPTAYLLGQCVRTGLRVAVTTQLAVATELDSDIVMITPDEVAALLAAQQEILKIKQLFPGATVEQITQEAA